jgi:hypothetical protein
MGQLACWPFQVVHEQFGDPAAADEVLADRDLVLICDAEHALVEKLVMDRAQAQAVVDVVRAAVGPPPHMRGFEARRRAVVKSAVELPQTPTLSLVAA